MKQTGLAVLVAAIIAAVAFSVWLNWPRGDDCLCVDCHCAGAAKFDGKSFAGELQRQLIERGSLSSGERRVLRILNAPDSPRRDRQLDRMERHVRVQLDLHPTDAVDWSAIDWPAMLEIVLRLLVALLPLLL